MIKAILFDADGVVIKKHPYFSDRLAKDYNIPTEKIIPFFSNEFGLCKLGKADLKDELSKYLDEWGWNKSTEDLLEYWFSSENNPNTEVLEIIKNLRANNVQCYLVSDQEKNRAEYILNEMKFKDYFDDSFFSCYVGYKKADDNFFVTVLDKFKSENIQPDEIMYWDDNEKALEIARNKNIKAFFYKGVDNLRQVLKDTQSHG